MDFRIPLPEEEFEVPLEYEDDDEEAEEEYEDYEDQFEPTISKKIQIFEKSGHHLSKLQAFLFFYESDRFSFTLCSSTFGRLKKDHGQKNEKISTFSIHGSVIQNVV